MAIAVAASDVVEGGVVLAHCCHLASGNWPWEVALKTGRAEERRETCHLSPVCHSMNVGQFKFVNLNSVGKKN